MEKVFVYGTLKSSERAAYMMRQHGRLIDDAVTIGTLVDLGPFPAYFSEGKGAVLGEVWEIATEGLSVLDAYEGEGSLYRRIRGSVETTDGITHEAWMYEYLGTAPRGNVIPEGFWYSKKIPQTY